MTSTRITLILTLTMALAGGLTAQETETTTRTATTSSANAAATNATAPAKSTAIEKTASSGKSAPTEKNVASETSASSAKEEREDTLSTEAHGSEETRVHFSALLRQHPPELATILSLDPTLLSNDAYLAGYPELATFVSAHPEVRRNPNFYLSDFAGGQRRSALEELSDDMAEVLIVGLIAFTLAWLVRTVVEQKRWTRLSRTQSEVHNKILDRFATSGELLDYVRSAAGTKFLESAPIPLHAERTPQKVGLTRVMWSIQLGVVVVCGAIGMLLVSGRFDPESAHALSALGAIALCVGIGFIASAIVSILLSRRLGLWAGTSDTSADEPAL